LGLSMPMAWMFPKPTVNMARGIVSSRMAPRLNVEQQKLVRKAESNSANVYSTHSQSDNEPRIRALRIGGKRLDITGMRLNTINIKKVPPATMGSATMALMIAMP